MAYGKFSEIPRSRVFEEIAGSIVFTGLQRLGVMHAAHKTLYGEYMGNKSRYISSYLHGYKG